MEDIKTTMDLTGFIAKIGLEIHVQLKTKSKMFCSCDNNAENTAPNTLVCPVCLGMPGTLPVTNKQAVEMTIKTGLAFGCQIPLESKFDRKHYFYPDLPKGFQISQYDKPFCLGGEIEVGGRKIRLNRIHLEEDAGKLTHLSRGRTETSLADKNYSLVDLNRAGTPLMEIVTEPDISTPAEARKFLEESQLSLRYLNVSDADMEKGHLRCDANISVESKVEQMSPIVEIKNLNSHKFVEQALSFEEKRLIDDFKNWPEKRTKITRGFDAKKGVTFEQRHKEEASDYRYFPEPDIPPITISEGQISEFKKEIVELPKEKKARYIMAGVSDDVAEKIVKSPYLVEYLESGENLQKELAVFISEEVNRAISDHEISFKEYKNRVPIARVSELLNFVKDGIVSKTAARKVFVEMVRTGLSATAIIKGKGLEQISDTAELLSTVNEVVKENPDLVEKFKNGKTQVVGFLVGQIMRKTSGKANPQVLNKLLIEKLNGNNYQNN